MALLIFGRQTILPENVLKKVFNFTVKELGNEKASANLVFISENKIKELNNNYRGKNKVTDVLSFVYNEDNLLGEIYISPIQIRRQAKEFKNPVEKELIKIFVHGIVHLFGYDHKNYAEAHEMEKKEEEILAQLNLKL